MATVHIFPDTNVLLHFPAFDGFDWRALCGVDDVVVHTTPPVLTELNKIKEIGHTKRIRKRAASVQRRLKELLQGDSAACHLGEGVRVIFEAETPNTADYPGLNSSVADDLLIAAALAYSARNKEDTALATDDNGLGLLVKANKWNVRLLEPPAEARLPEEPDEEDKEKEQLRRRVAILESALPRLQLSFTNSDKVLKIERPKMGLETTVATALSEEKDKHHFLPDPTEPKPRGMITLSALAAMNQDYASLMRNDPAEVNKYNAALEDYFRDFEDAKRENVGISRRLSKIELQVENCATAPARDVLVGMHFPNGLTVIDKKNPGKIFRKAPEPPLLPGQIRGFADPMRSWMPNLAAMTHHNPESPSLSIRKTNSYDVRWRIPKLRQDHVSDIDPVYVLFDSEPFSFRIDYSIVADNLPETVSGQLHVVAPAD